MTSFRTCKKDHIADARATTRTRSNDKIKGMIMKTLLSALLALTVLAGVAASASAFDSKTFYQEQDRSRY